MQIAESEKLNGNIENPADALKFMFAGNAYFTLVSKKTGARYTYRINKAKDSNNDQETMPWGKKGQKHQHPTWFVSLLSGPDNVGDYVYLGLVEEINGQKLFRLTRASKMTSQSAPVKAITFALEIFKHNQISLLLEFWHAGRCGRCGKKLTVPEYKSGDEVWAGIKLGIGPECAGNL